MTAVATNFATNIDTKPRTIIVLAGGPGCEREVSLESGKMVADALERLGHQVTIRDINPGDHSALDEPTDVFFVALHGTFGEDGQVQRLLEQRNLVYTGSGPDASALAMDKVATKNRWVEQNIATPAFDVVFKQGSACKIKAPAVVKPINSGSSVDVTIARDAATLSNAMDDVADRYGSALVEQFVDGLELTVSILDDQPLQPIQIRTKRGFYDYQAKYIDDDTEYLLDIPLSDDILKEIQLLSQRAARIVGCRDFCRVDWMVDKRSKTPYAIEINTIPGLTSHSLLPKAANAIGIGFEQLCQRIIDLALKRAANARVAVS